MKFTKIALAVFLGASLCHVPCAARAEYLFNNFLTPTFQTQYTAWDVFYTPYGSPNYPDYAAPYGSAQPASSAGVTPPGNSSPSNPTAYWDSRNATITQTGAPGAFIIGPGVPGGGNIYSPGGATAYTLANTNAAGFGTVNFQFQTDGTLLDFSGIRLQYTNGSVATVSLAATDYIREYRSSGSSFGGLTNRAALQWNLGGLGITSYRITFAAPGTSNSLQQAVLDTATTYGGIVPASRFWTQSGTGNWNTGANWQQGSTSVENGNVRFLNSAATTVTLDASHTIGELSLETPSNVTINPSGGSGLTANTGITTAAAATGIYTINAPWTMNAFNRFDIEAGAVTVNGVVSGAYGFEKDGAGTLTLAANNTFTGSVNVGGGTLRLNGSNNYAGTTTVLDGTLIAGADGALGSATTNVALGADSALFSEPVGSAATLVLDGNRSVSRGVSLASGTNGKRLATINSAAGSTFSGVVNFGTDTLPADNVRLTATAATDRLTFSGAMSGGATAASVAVDGAGTVIFSGAAKTYANATNVTGGTLQIAGGASFTGSGAMTVSGGAALRVDGTLGGGGTLTLNAGVLTGGGTVARVFTVGTGAMVAPGSGGVGTLATASETWASGGNYQWEINGTAANGSGVNPGQDLLSIGSSLSLTGTSTSRFTLQLRTLTTAGAAGLLAGFNPATGYSWLLTTATGGINGFDAGAFLVDASGFVNPVNGAFSVSQTGNQLYLNYAPAPEPAAWMILAFGIGTVVAVKRRAAYIHARDRREGRSIKLDNRSETSNQRAISTDRGSSVLSAGNIAGKVHQVVRSGRVPPPESGARKPMQRES